MSKSRKSLHYAERRIEVFSHPGWDERHPAGGPQFTATWCSWRWRSVCEAERVEAGHSLSCSSPTRFSFDQMLNIQHMWKLLMGNHTIRTQIVIVTRQVLGDPGEGAGRERWGWWARRSILLSSWNVPSCLDRAHTQVRSQTNYGLGMPSQPDGGLLHHRGPGAAWAPLHLGYFLIYSFCYTCPSLLSFSQRPLSLGGQWVIKYCPSREMCGQSMEKVSLQKVDKGAPTAEFQGVGAD